ncbi:cystinosin homolog isoform X2 [Lucilia sericata]|uniref:cystinosin homolog isoform X2 n=1 Tax=Lucilia sericata TaxID=13632 RepID=UPI0018A87B6E|nr:cystinosin homolog isoform X2 [Lucilia sericata]
MKISNLATQTKLSFTLLLLTILTQTWAQAPKGLSISTHDITVLINSSETVYVYVNDALEQHVTVILKPQHDNLALIEPTQFDFNADGAQNQSIVVTGLKPGHLEVTADSQPDEEWIVKDVFLRITVANSEAIIYTSLIFGWIYFVAWSVSFYPQIWVNYRRKSVVGLNFDFVFLNLLGFTLYSIFNCGLYWIPEIQAEYTNRYPRGLNPVMLNDVVFSLHAMFATIITIYQCYAYERGEQSISKTATALLSLFILFVIICCGLAAGNVIHWLDFLYYCSYVKLTITIIKYVPQALMNYRRKSTIGWSIGNILLDFTGGTLSMLQMILNAYNYDDWVSIFGDPTKFGLGLFSVLFDIFFMLQHYVFYSNTQPYESLPGDDNANVANVQNRADLERNSLNRDSVLDI